MVLGITGNIASGKSRVAARFGELGAAVVSADQLAREAVAPGTAALAAIVRRFGQAILRDDGSLDRQKLGGLVFADSEARRQLESITHPAIARLAEERLMRLRGTRKLIVYEAPLLFEAGAEGRVDRVLVVTAEEEVRLARLMDRDGLDRRAALQRIRAQLPQEQKAVRADYVIDNSGDWQECCRQVDALWRELTASE
ncbi:MAG: dephospho-CoA kinase [Deltaproteobacteria bacterium]|nr:MAG: dephospho-CoA kinase [Deltaproteobacteria bacterium]